MNAIEPLNEIRTQLEARDTELTSSLESIEREREIVRKQLGLIQELASLEEQRAGTGTSPVIAKATAPSEAARAASQPATAAASAPEASESGEPHEGAKADTAKPEPARPEPAKSEPVRPDAAKPEPAKPGLEAPAPKDEPAAAPFGRGPSPWPRSAGEPDTELLRRIRAS